MNRTRQEKSRDRAHTAVWLAVLVIVIAALLACCNRAVVLGETDSEDSYEFQLAQERMALADVPQTAEELFAITGYEEDPMESEKIEEAILNKPDKPYPLSDEELDLVCRTVMAEAGGETYEEMLGVSQSLMNGCIRNGCRPEAQIAGFFTTPAESYTELVWCAVTAVFFEGETVTDENICWFYNPSVCGESAFHEGQQYVMTIGQTRFFAPER